MNALATPAALFESIEALDVIDVHGQAIELDPLATECLQTGSGVLIHDESGRAELAWPVYRGDLICSIVKFRTRLMLGDDSSDLAVGAIELWRSKGDYGDLGLTAGFYGKLERFANVSSFVRFESGIGLPGQVWQSRRCVIHDDLPNHPGFLRSAGASAGSLDMAVGIPVGDAEMVETLVMVSSKQSPLSGSLEVWSIDDGQFELRESRYADNVDLSLRHTAGQTMDLNHGLAGLALQHGGATTSTNPVILGFGTSCERCWSSGLAIPIFEDGKPVEVVTMSLMEP